MIFLLDFDFATLGHVRKLFLLLDTGRRELSAQPFFCFVAKGFAGLREQGYAIACADWDGGGPGFFELGVNKHTSKPNQVGQPVCFVVPVLSNTGSIQLCAHVSLDCGQHLPLVFVFLFLALKPREQRF